MHAVASQARYGVIGSIIRRTRIAKYKPLNLVARDRATIKKRMAFHRAHIQGTVGNAAQLRNFT